MQSAGVLEARYASSITASSEANRPTHAISTSVLRAMGSLIKKRRKRMRKKKHKKMLKRTRFQRRAAGK